MPMQPRAEQAFRDFLQRAWRSDIVPLLHERQAVARRGAARAGGRGGAALGLALDMLLGLRGRPFARALTILGGSAGALLPDLWDWQWFTQRAGADTRQTVTDRLRECAGALEVVAALEFFDLPPQADFEQVRKAWRQAALRWHPDRATSDAERAEHHVRFVAYQAAYERLERHFSRASGNETA